MTGACPCATAAGRVRRPAADSPSPQRAVGLARALRAAAVAVAALNVAAAADCHLLSAGDGLGVSFPANNPPSFAPSAVRRLPISLRGAGDGNGGTGAVINPLLVRTASASVVIVHGTGGSGDNWSYLALALSFLRLNAVRWVLPTAAERPTGSSGALRPSWFDVFGVDESSPEDEPNILAAVDRIKGLVAAEVARGMPAERVFVMGFSQGGAVALTHALRSPVRVGGTVVLSGWLPLRTRYPVAVSEANRDSPILMLHGELDDRVPFASAEKSARLVGGFGVNVTFLAYPTKGHVLVDEKIITMAEDFILLHAPGQKVDLLRKGVDRFLEVVANMASYQPNTPIDLISVDLGVPPAEQEKPLHNRWHPAIPPVATVATGCLFRAEAIDWTGGQIGNTDDATDVRDVDLSRCHHLSGPIRVEDAAGAPAAPGDLLVVEVADIGPLRGHEWGYTGIFDASNGGGFLADHFPVAAKAVWGFEGRFASSRHIPGVRFPGLIHTGLIGTAPSAELLAEWNEREGALVATGEERLTLPKHLATRPLASLPNPKGALLGAIRPNHPDHDRIAGEAARTIPGRENGGNCDIKNLTVGAKVYLPVFVEGANLSFGDIHFSQGDGEVSFCGAIEMAGYVVLKTDIIRGGVAKYLTPTCPTRPLSVYPLFEVSPLEPRFTEWLVFEGQSVDEAGVQHFLDASISYKQCVLSAIAYLAKFGYTREQVYLLLSCCPCEGRISGIVDAPNACTTLAIPTRIFDQDIRPSQDGPPVGPRLVTRGDCARVG
ncbi:hypothetical protein I4F81_010507 [Pyropia yezoensis]|uniref:Uncharacterized protein n=1 Tax=Pyropia yezoensis TaxID=2788 RepID=A0ACC3CDH2_PYRYE|nr:hypothetical protein I4F81_010507 [Neopyropia yezoensis]